MTYKKRTHTKRVEKDGERKCTKCEVFKPFDEYYANGVHKPNGRIKVKTICKVCTQKYNSAKYRANRADDVTPRNPNIDRSKCTEWACNQCNETKPIENFYWNKIHKTWNSYCKQCKSVYNKESFNQEYWESYKERNKAKLVLYRQEYYKKNKKRIDERTLEYYYKKKAEDRNKPHFEEDKDD